MMNKVAVGILGATGIVGQQYVQLLADHPLFEIAFLTASSRNSGKTYREAVAGRWRGLGPTPEKVFNLPVYGVDDIKRASSLCRFVFSALDTDTAKVYEQLYASKGLPVISNTSAHRLDPDVPLLIPEINPHHLAMIPLQKKRRGWENGFIVAKPNCSLQSYLMPLAPLHETFKIRKIIVTTMQSVSGGGYPGVASLDIHDNIIPYIPNEEEKSEKEVLKILGRVAEDRFAQEEDLIISAHCNRVPVLDGHLACVSVGFEKKPTLEQILSVWEEFRGLPQQRSLPSAPSRPILYHPSADRPQPRLDRLSEKGMAITAGRLRPCPVLDFRFVALSHNTLRGAAGGGILNAELLLSENFIR